MTKIEEQLRNAFDAQLTELPLSHDPAGTAIAGAGRVRRRRTVVMAAAAVVTVIAVAAGVGLLNSRDNARPTPPATPPVTGAPPVEVLVGDTLHTPDGRKLRLPGYSGEDSPTVVGVPAGWVYLNRNRMALITEQGASKVYDSSEGVDDDFVVSADGRRVAWWDAKREALYVAGIAGSGFTDVQKVESQDAPISPVLWAGGRLVLSKGTGEEEGYRYDSWDPDAGRFVPHWSEPRILNLSAGSEDGRFAYGYEGEGVGQVCLHAYDIGQGFKATGRTCKFSPGHVMGGRWMVHFGEKGVQFVDIATAFDSRPRVLSGCSDADIEQFAPVEPRSALVRSLNGELTRCTITGDRVEKTPLDTSHMPKGDYTLVARKGS